MTLFYDFILIAGYFSIQEIVNVQYDEGNSVLPDLHADIGIIKGRGNLYHNKNDVPV